MPQAGHPSASFCLLECVYAQEHTHTPQKSKQDSTLLYMGGILC